MYFFYLVPQTVDELLQKLNGKNAADRIGIIKNLIRSQKVHVGVSVKQFLINFFKVLVNYVFLTIKEVSIDLTFTLSTPFDF